MPNYEDRDRDVTCEDPRDRKPGTSDPSDGREKDHYGREGQAPDSPREPGSGQRTGESSGQNEASRGSGPSGSEDAE